MIRVARGEFVVKLLPLAFEGLEGPSQIGRMSINKSISGDLVATTVGQMLSAMTDVPGSAGYVAIERVDGVLEGKHGTFVLQHTATMTRGTPSHAITVVPDSGTGELVGLAGEFTIIIAEGKHSYEFEYLLPPAEEIELLRDVAVSEEQAAQGEVNAQAAVAKRLRGRQDQ